jgi:hypothetical protein
MGHLPSQRWRKNPESSLQGSIMSARDPLEILDPSIQRETHRPPSCTRRRLSTGNRQLVAANHPLPGGRL